MVHKHIGLHPTVKYANHNAVSLYDRVLRVCLNCPLFSTEYGCAKTYPPQIFEHVKLPVKK